MDWHLLKVDQDLQMVVKWGQIMQKPLILVVELAQTQPAKRLLGESKLVGTGKDVNNSGGRDIIRQRATFINFIEACFEIKISAQQAIS